MLRALRAVKHSLEVTRRFFQAHRLTLVDDDTPAYRLCWGLNSHCFPMVGMVINLIVGVYIPITRIPIKGGMTIPNIRSLDCGTCGSGNTFRTSHTGEPHSDTILP